MFSPLTATRSIQILGLLVIAALLGACGDGGNGTVCTLEARASVVVTVVDQSSAPLSGATATYQVDGGPAQVQACEPNGTCLIGQEVSGVFTIVVTRPGYITSSATVFVNSDQCHVITEYLTQVLHPVR